MRRGGEAALRLWSVWAGIAYGLALWALSGEPGLGVTRTDLVGVGAALSLLVLASAANTKAWGLLAVALCFGLGSIAAFYLFAAFATPETAQGVRIALRYVAGGALVTAALEALLLTDWLRGFRRDGEAVLTGDVVAEERAVLLGVAEDLRAEGRADHAELIERSVGRLREACG